MDANWLATEAVRLHGIFQDAFFAMVGGFLVLAVAVEFFKLPLGQMPGFTNLVARCLIAALLLAALPQIMNFMGDLTDSVVKQIGDLNNFKLVLEKLGEKFKTLSFSWTSVRDVVTILISFLSFLGLYITVYFADAAFIYCWTLIYVFSPLVFALYVFPQTEGATKALFRSVVEVSLWKIMWAAMATLLWSTAVSDLNKPDVDINWLTAIVLNLMLMISVLMTPKIVNSLLSGGFSQLASGLQGAALQTASLTPANALAKAKGGLSALPNKGWNYAASKLDDQRKRQQTNFQAAAKATPPATRPTYHEPYSQRCASLAQDSQRKKGDWI